MVLVDAQGRIVHANLSAHAMLKDGSVLTAPGGKLTAVDAAADPALHEAFLETAGMAGPSSKGIAASSAMIGRATIRSCSWRATR
jgi:hypothetical protein